MATMAPLPNQWQPINYSSNVHDFVRMALYGYPFVDLNLIKFSYYDDLGNHHRNPQRLRIKFGNQTAIVNFGRDAEQMRKIFAEINWTSADKPIGSFAHLGEW
jgi:hypothetical protein